MVGGKVALRRIRRSNRAGVFAPVSDPVGIRAVFMVRRCVRGGAPVFDWSFTVCLVVGFCVYRTAGRVDRSDRMDACEFFYARSWCATGHGRVWCVVCA